MSYLHYTYRDFIGDPDFIQWVLHPSSDKDNYWKQIIKEHPELESEIKKAREIIMRIRIEKPILPAEKRKEIESRIFENIAYKQKRQHILSIFQKVAACAVIVLSIAIYFTWQPNRGKIDYQLLTEVPDELLNGGNVQLILNDSNKMELENKSHIKYHSDKIIISHGEKAEQENESSSLEANVREKQENKLNKLIVPRGKSSFVELIDGTKVWINSGSVLIYPSEFEKDKREIYVNGEIYLEVVHDENKPFIVKTSGCDVKVLGTSFNITAYQDDNLQSIVLAEGKVAVTLNEDSRSFHLMPNEKLDIADNQVTKHLVEVAPYISWKDGYFIFKQETVQNILKRISRYYNVEIEYKEDIPSFTCSGKLNLNLQIDKVIETIQSTAPINIKQSGNTLSIYSK